MGGGDNDAAEQAQRQERQRRRQINNAIANINRVFSDPERQEQYDDYRENVLALNKTALNDKYEDAQRALKFSLARTGQTGGSVDANLTANTNESYLEGLLRATKRAREATSRLRSADAQSKQNLISLAQSGLSSTQAATQAAADMQANIQMAQSLAVPRLANDLFDVAASYYANSLTKDQPSLGSYFTRPMGSTDLYSPYGGRKTRYA
ncbi:MAG TPA: hypothetical protein VFP95_02445 [Gammaproteobacteria bacterium]|nr:hypothetical protein [Gammaproteobacteria bacterium]